MNRACYMDRKSLKRKIRTHRCQIKSSAFGIFFFYAIFCFVTVITISFGSTESLKKECDIIDLFKEGKYKEIIDSTRGVKDMLECEKLLVAKSFERLGLYNQSIKVLKELYINKNPLHAFTAYFIAVNYDKLNDHSNAFRWYRNVLNTSFHYPENFGGETDRVAITNATLFKLVQLGLHERRIYNLIEKLLKKSAKDLIEAQYALALLYHRAGALQQATDNYINILHTENELYQELVMEQVSKDFRVIRIIGERGISKTDLVHLCIKYELYSGALLISYQLPYSMYVAQLRAYCFFEIGDYQSSVVMYNEYYTEYKDPEALVKIAY